MPEFIIHDDQPKPDKSALPPRLFRTGVNGKQVELEIGTKYEAEQELIDHLCGLDIDIEVIGAGAEGAGSASEEGSVEAEPVVLELGVAKHAEIVDAANPMAAGGEPGANPKVGHPIEKDKSDKKPDKDK